METKQKLDDEFKNKRAEDYSNKVLNVSSSMNWGVHMYHGAKIQMDTSKAMGEHWARSKIQQTKIVITKI